MNFEGLMNYYQQAKAFADEGIALYKQTLVMQYHAVIWGEAGAGINKVTEALSILM